MPDIPGLVVETSEKLRRWFPGFLCFGVPDPATSSCWMRGAASISTCQGYTMPLPGLICGLSVGDEDNNAQTTFLAHDNFVSFSQGDRIGVYLDYDAPWFDAVVYKNGVATSVYVNLVLPNRDLTALVVVRLFDPDPTTLDT